MSAIKKYNNLSTLARKLRADLAGVELILLYAYRRCAVHQRGRAL